MGYMNSINDQYVNMSKVPQVKVISNISLEPRFSSKDIISIQTSTGSCYTQDERISAKDI